MKFLVDTNVISELRKGAKANPGVRSWFDGVASSSLYTSVLVMGELQRGVELITRRDFDASRHLALWLQRVESNYAQRILNVDMNVVSIFGKLGLEQPLPPIDGLLAATALHHNMTLVTRNVKDVERTPVTVVNPFS